MVHEQTIPMQDFVRNETITMTVTSDYYRGWESYFRTQTDDTVIRTVDHANRSVTVEFGYPNADSTHETAGGPHHQESYERSPQITYLNIAYHKIDVTDE